MPDLEQFQSERSNLGQHALQGGLIRQESGQQRVPVSDLRVQGGKRGAHRAAQLAADAELVAHRPPPGATARAMRATENRHKTTSRTEKANTAGKVPVKPASTPTPTTGMIRPA